MLSPLELASCRDLLVSARTVALWVAAVFHGDGNLGAAVRLRSIADRLDSEIADIERLLLTPQKP
jgi:hypothetical protein